MPSATSTLHTAIPLNVLKSAPRGEAVTLHAGAYPSTTSALNTDILLNVLKLAPRDNVRPTRSTRAHALRNEHTSHGHPSQRAKMGPRGNVRPPRSTRAHALRNERTSHGHPPQRAQVQPLHDNVRPPRSSSEQRSNSVLASSNVPGCVLRGRGAACFRRVAPSARRSMTEADENPSAPVWGDCFPIELRPPRQALPGDKGASAVGGPMPSATTVLHTAILLNVLQFGPRATT